MALRYAVVPLSTAVSGVAEFPGKHLEAQTSGPYFSGKEVLEVFARELGVPGARARSGST